METKLIQLPVPIELRQRLRELADQDRRSMTAEAIWILEREVERRLGEVDNTQFDINALNDPDLIMKVR